MIDLETHGFDSHRQEKVLLSIVPHLKKAYMFLVYLDRYCYDSVFFFIQIDSPPYPF